MSRLYLGAAVRIAGAMVRLDAAKRPGRAANDNGKTRRVAPVFRLGAVYPKASRPMEQPAGSVDCSSA